MVWASKIHMMNFMNVISLFVCCVPTCGHVRVHVFFDMIVCSSCGVEQHLISA